MSEKAQSNCCSGGGSLPVMEVVYDRNVHTVAYHHPLKQEISLEGCSAFGGQGADLNPIDLLVMGVGSCMLIVMGKTAETENIDIVGAKTVVSYELANYQIAAINVDFFIPGKLSPEEQSKLEAASQKCPVYLALSPSVKVTLKYCWGE